MPIFAPILFAIEERGYVFWAVVILFVSAVPYILIKAIRDAKKRVSNLQGTANEINADFFPDSSATQFLEQLQALRFPFFTRGYYDQVTNIFQNDISEGRIFHFDYWRRGYSGRSAKFGSVVLLVNRSERCAEPFAVSNCLIEKCFRRFWHVDYAELRAALRQKLRQKPTCHVEVSNDGLLYFSRHSGVEEVEEKMQFVRELFALVDDVPSVAAA